jgi:hypothetical protein
MGVTAFQGGGGHGPSKKDSEAATDSVLGAQLSEHAHPTVARALKLIDVVGALADPSRCHPGRHCPENRDLVVARTIGHRMRPFTSRRSWLRE